MADLRTCYGTLSLLPPVWLSRREAGTACMLELIDLPLDGRLAVVALAAFVGGFMRGFVGFGAALVTMPVLSTFLGPTVAVAVTSIMGITATIQLLPEAIRHSEYKMVLPVAVAMFLAAPVGATALVYSDPAVMKIVISVLVMVMALVLASGWKPRGLGSRGTLIAAGGIGGLVQGVAGMGGPPVVAVALTLPGEIKKVRANVLGLMTALSFSSVPALLWFGLFTGRVIATAALLLPIYIAATALGSRYFAYGGSRHYRNAAYATLLAIGAGSLIAAIRGWLLGA
jgi:uncharacterized membrane protein YfcA